jgi:hypothetical protein
MEKEKIIQIISSIFSNTDKRNWQNVQSGISENVLLDFTSMVGGNPSSQTPQQITNAWAAVLPGFDKTHHQLSNFQGTIKDNIANFHYTGKADHFIGNEVWTVEAAYETELKKENDKWLVTKHKLNLIKQSGNTNLPAQAIQNVKDKKSKTIRQKIKFNSDGFILAGNLYTPENFDPSKKYPAILVGGSWTTVKEQMSGLYAEKLAKQGFVTLAFDPHYFGESEGEPRFWENPNAKIADFKNAITYLGTVQGVDTRNIFLAAVCASAGYMGTLAAHDKRVKGFATIAAWLHDEEAVKLIYGGEEGVQSRIKQARKAEKKFAEAGEVEYIPSISKTDKSAAMYGDYDYYLNSNRGAVPQWSADKFAAISWEGWLTFNPMPNAKNIHVPVIMIHADNAVLPDNAKKFFNDIAHEDKVLHWTEGTQFDFYDRPKQVSEAVEVASDFFKKHIS